MCTGQWALLRQENRCSNAILTTPTQRCYFNAVVYRVFDQTPDQVLQRDKMLQVLVCGVVVFPGLFFTFRKVLPSIFKRWTDADVVLVSERWVCWQLRPDSSCSSLPFASLLLFSSKTSFILSGWNIRILTPWQKQLHQLLKSHCSVCILGHQCPRDPQTDSQSTNQGPQYKKIYFPTTVTFKQYLQTLVSFPCTIYLSWTFLDPLHIPG